MWRIGGQTELERGLRQIRPEMRKSQPYRFSVQQSNFYQEDDSEFQYKEQVRQEVVSKLVPTTYIYCFLLLNYLLQP